VSCDGTGSLSGAPAVAVLGRAAGGAPSEHDADALHAFRFGCAYFFKLALRLPGCSNNWEIVRSQRACEPHEGNLIGSRINDGASGLCHRIESEISE